MSRATKRAARMLVLVSVLTGCMDDQTSPTDSRGNVGEGGAMGRGRGGMLVPELRMQTLLKQITREVAVALSDPVLRTQVYDALQASPHREHKLHFASFLRGEGGALLGGMAGVRRTAPGVAPMPSAARVEEAVLLTLDSIVDLEFYMPIKAHFAAWRGGTDLIVASALRDDGRVPDGFAVGGQPLALRAEAPPDTPTLVVVPLETDFSRPLAGAGPAGINTAETDIAGVYMTRAIVYDDHEGWPNGDPEFEVHLFQTDIDHEYIDQICAGQQQTAPYQWNHQETQDWSGTVLLATEGRLGLSPNNQFQMWEDDTGPCTATGGRPPDTEGATVSQYATWASAILGVVSSVGGSDVTLVRNVLNAIPATYNFASAFLEDDEVGTLSLVAMCWPGLNGVPDAGPVWFWIISSEDHSVQGSALLDFRFSTAREPICQLRVVAGGPSFTYEGTNYTWTANVSYGSPPYTYQWYRDGDPVSTNASYSETVFMPNFDLRVVVTDAAGNTASGLRRVIVSNCTPPQKAC